MLAKLRLSTFLGLVILGLRLIVRLLRDHTSWLSNRILGFLRKLVLSSEPILKTVQNISHS